MTLCCSACCEAEAFDAGQLLLQVGRREPDSSWSTAALLRLIHDQILLGPWERPQPLHELAATSVPVWAGSVLDLLDRRSPVSEAR